MISVPLNSIASIVRGITFAKSEGELKPENNYLPVIRAGSIQQELLLDEGRIWVPKSKIKDDQLIRKNDIIMCTSSGSADLVGKCAISNENWNGSFGAFCCGIRADYSKCIPSYLYFFLNSPVFKEWTKTALGANIKNIRASELAEFKIPLPPLSTQKQIAAILEKADQLRKDCQQMEQELTNLAQSVFIDMFGEIEEVDKLDSHIEFLTSGSRGWAQYYANSGARFIRSLDVQMNFIGNDDIAYVTPPHGQEAIRTKVQIGDVLLTITGSRIGRVSPVPKGFGDAHISQHVALIRLKKELLPEFLSYYLSMPSFGQRQIEKSQYGQTKPGLKLDHIREFTVPKIDVEKQRRFVSFMESIDAVKTNNYLNQIEVETIFASLMQKAFIGELKLNHKAA